MSTQSIEVNGHTFELESERTVAECTCRFYRCGDVQLVEDSLGGMWRCIAGGKIGEWQPRPLDALLSLSRESNSWAPALAAFARLGAA